MKAEEKFKIIEGAEIPPDHLKKNVMTHIKLANLFLELGDLFSIKLAKVVGGLFTQKDNDLHE